MDIIIYFVVVIVFSFIIISSVRFIFFHSKNRNTLQKYKRENNNNDIRFKNKRCLEDGDKGRRHHVYLVNDEVGTYQRIEDGYTLKKLGYGAGSREDRECFSKEKYIMGERIVVRKILPISPKELFDFIKQVLRRTN